MMHSCRDGPLQLVGKHGVHSGLVEEGCCSPVSGAVSGDGPRADRLFSSGA